jgi:hypothetical protein
MSFLADPPLLLATGETYARAMPEAAQGRIAGLTGALTVGAFWAAAAAIWSDHPVARPLRKALGYRTGPDFMLRFPLPPRGRRRRASGREEAVAAAALATYPLWLWLGWDHGRRARPRGA